MLVFFFSPKFDKHLMSISAPRSSEVNMTSHHAFVHIVNLFVVAFYPRPKCRRGAYVLVFQV